MADAFIRDRATNTPPIAELTAAVDGRRVTVDATASHDPDGAGVTGSISFGDGSPDWAGLSAVHEYARGGTFSVAVTDADGVSATKAVAVVVPNPVAPAPPPPPDGTVIVAPPEGAPPPPRLVLDRVGLSRTRFAVVPRAQRRAARGARTSRCASARPRVGTRALPVGRHRVRVGARTSDGRTAGPRTLTFTNVAAKRARR